MVYYSSSILVKNISLFQFPYMSYTLLPWPSLTQPSTFEDFLHVLGDNSIVRWSPVVALWPSTLPATSKYMPPTIRLFRLNDGFEI